MATPTADAEHDFDELLHRHLTHGPRTDGHPHPIGRELARRLIDRDGDPTAMMGTFAAGADIATGRVAVISDVHANLPALDATLDAIDATGITRIWCLGDTLGYGAWPVECLRLVRERCELVLAGNHDLAVTGDEPIDMFGHHARPAIARARRELDAAPEFRAANTGSETRLEGRRETMSIKSSDTILKTLDSIHRGDYVLPSIQREFVWGTDQIVSLFDSLMRDYPIGTFLFWRIEPERSSDYSYYGFLKDYHERTASHCPTLDPQHDRAMVAILDGQQRLTSLNIGLSGSYASKLPNKRRDKALSYPAKRLYLDVLYEATDEDNFEYRFEFLTDERAADNNDKGGHWFLVPQILDPAWRGTDANADEQVDNYLDQFPGWTGQQVRLARRRIMKLWRIVHSVETISYFEEANQDLDRVLDIFIRVNSGGTTLSKSDLLMSIATAQWSGERDARTVIYTLVDDLNDTHHGFNFNKDWVLKTGLVATDVADVGFKVQNFTSDNMTRLEQKWDGIARAMRLAVDLAATFGFNSRTLSATSALIPVADYLHMRSAPDDYVTAAAYRSDRDAIRDWLTRSLLKHGVWGSGLDSTLRDIRGAIRSDGHDGFPVQAIEAAMRRRGKILTFDAEELDDLLDTKYGTPRAFMLLALLYPGIDVRDPFHMDHLFPQAWFTRKRLRHAGVADHDLDAYADARDRLGNLQLIRGIDNTRKRDMAPHDWFAAEYPDAAARREVLAANFIDELPADFSGFLDFYAARRARMRERLHTLLRVKEPVATSA
ncbi:MAG: DUF262 domain-containing protein [Thermoleophilia bacterium]|nr:DUF262 domain-containing protein [Thermoleophilia bacterium]